MSSQEAYYVRVEETERGPYSLRHLKHLYATGMIRAGAVYWQEGMEEWTPVEKLCEPLIRGRSPLPRILRWALFSLVAAILVSFGIVFGPTLVEGWKEASQNEFTAEAAYWKAREYVRAELKKRGQVVIFEPFLEENVTLGADQSARVRLPSEVSTLHSPGRPVRWEVTLRYRPGKRADWKGVEMR